MEIDAARRRAEAEARKSNSKKTTIQETEPPKDLHIKGDPLEFNEGDIDLEPYLKPLIA